MSIIDVLNKYKISHVIAALILKSGVVHNRKLPCNEMCHYVTMSKHCGPSHVMRVTNSLFPISRVLLDGCSICMN